MFQDCFVFLYNRWPSNWNWTQDMETEDTLQSISSFPNGNTSFSDLLLFAVITYLLLYLCQISGNHH